MGELATLARLKAIDDRIDKISDAIEELRSEISFGTSVRNEMRAQLEKHDDLIAGIRERQGMPRETITVPPPPKILYDIGLLSPEQKILSPEQKTAT